MPPESLTGIKVFGPIPCYAEVIRHRQEASPMRLFMILFSMIGTAMAGSGIVAVLTLGYGTLWPIVTAAAAGAAAALPVSWLVAREIDS
jgi:hypothetical protein